MLSHSHGLSEGLRAQYADLLKLAATLDEQAEAQHLHGDVRAALSCMAMYTLFDAIPALEEDCFDLCHPPEDPAAWRGGQSKRLQNRQ